MGASTKKKFQRLSGDLREVKVDKEEAGNSVSGAVALTTLCPLASGGRPL